MSDIDELNKINKKREDAISKLQNISHKNDSKEQEPIFENADAIKQIAGQMNNNLKPDEIKKMKIHQAVEMILKPMQELTEQQLIGQLLENSRDSKLHDIFVDFPMITKFVVKLMRDKKAIPQASIILEDQKKLIKFSAIMICTIIFGFFLAKVLVTSTTILTRIFFFFILRTMIMFSIRIGLIVMFFGDELTPFFNLFMVHFFG
jgi:hypothetical protein